MKIEIKLDRDRRKPGTLMIADVIAVPCLGKADNAAAAKVGNPSRSPIERNGDTPRGSYMAQVGSTYAATAAQRRSYGPHPVIRLTPQAGECLTAHKLGRRGLLIHGGDPAADGVSLRPTHGCIRLSNKHQGALVEVLKMSGELVHLVEITERTT